MLRNQLAPPRTAVTPRKPQSRPLPPSQRSRRPPPEKGRSTAATQVTGTRGLTEPSGHHRAAPRGSLKCSACDASEPPFPVASPFLRLHLGELGFFFPF